VSQIETYGNKRITKFVITGGPGAGKSTALGRIEQKLSEKGYRVLAVPETATELICGGIFWGENSLNVLDFHIISLQLQLYKERLFEQAAQKMHAENIVILHDRGTLDVKAYCGDAMFEDILKLLELKEVDLEDNYDAVFHLKTAAAGAEEFYTIKNNKARTESPEQAREIDDKTINAWIGHQHLRIINSDLDFENKLNRLMVEIFSLLGLPPLEIERKFLVRMPDLNQLTSQYFAEKTDLFQTFLLADEPDEEKRLRKRGKNGGCTYFLTKKRATHSILSRIEQEEKITQKEYYYLLQQADPALKQFSKERYCFVYGNLYFQLDVYPFWKDYAILEIELTAEEQNIELPPFITVLKEVTDDSAFKDYSLAKSIPEII